MASRDQDTSRTKFGYASPPPRGLATFEPLSIVLYCMHCQSPLPWCLLFEDQFLSFFWPLTSSIKYRQVLMKSISIAYCPILWVLPYPYQSRNVGDITWLVYLIRQLANNVLSMILCIHKLYGANITRQSVGLSPNSVLLRSKGFSLYPG